MEMDSDKDKEIDSYSAKSSEGCTDEKNYATFANNENNSEKLDGPASNADTLETLSKHDSGFLQALSNYCKAYIDIEIMSIAEAIRNPGVILGTMCI
jgi:hypothetical protein